MFNLFCAQNCAIPESSETQKCSPRSFSVQWDKKFDKIRDLSLLCTKFFDAQNFLKHYRFHLEIFLLLSDQQFLTESRVIPLMCRTIHYPKVVKHRSVPPRNFLVLWYKNFYRKSWYTLLCTIFSDAQNFLKHWRVRLRNFSLLWDKKCLTENCDIPPLMHEIFEDQNIVEHWMFRLRIISLLWDKKIDRELSCMPLVHKTCQYPKPVKLTKVPQRNFLVLWYKQISDRKSF